MTDFYQPTLLFRQNAIRRPGDFTENLDQYKAKNSSWVFDSDTNKDTKIMNKVCSLDRLNIKSNYWKIPDNNMNLTSMAIKIDDGMGKLAISSGNLSNNLYTYELDINDNYLTHQNTISLPNIHSMRWVPNTSNLLMSGNSKGYGHLISIPENPGDSAEIIKRFNHRKHLKSINKDPSIFLHTSTIIEKMNFISKDQLISIYDNNLFNWDINDCTSSTRPKPKSITSINGLTNFDTTLNDNVLGICGKFGVSLLDLRDPKCVIPSSIIHECKKTKLAANLIKWSKTSDNIFAASHLDGVIRLWDIRKQDSFGNLHGHHGKQVNAMEWIEGDLFSGGKNGNIIHWDLTNDVRDQDIDLYNCGLKLGLDSVQFDPKTNTMDSIVNQRQCGTVLPASNTNIISLESVETSDDLKVLSIDGSSFFGLHSRIYDAVDITYSSKKAYYTAEDIKLLQASQDNSNTTLVDDNDTELIHSLDITKPLTISRNPTQLKRSNTIILVHSDDFEFVKPQPMINETINSSNDTLLDVEIETSKFDVEFDFNHKKSLSTSTSPSAYSTSAESNSSSVYSDDTNKPIDRKISQSSMNSEHLDLGSPDSFASSCDTVDTIATSINDQEPFFPGHQYKLSDFNFNPNEFITT